MIPRRMEAFLRVRLSEQTWTNRLVREDGRCYMEFAAVDVERLARLGIEVDDLGPYLLVCMWDEASPLEVGGYLAVDNLAMGKPSMGGIRMLQDITPGMVHSLARAMTMKNAASNLPFGGGKVGIIAERSLTAEEHTEVVRCFARLLYRYRTIFLPWTRCGHQRCRHEDHRDRKWARYGCFQTCRYGRQPGGSDRRSSGRSGDRAASLCSKKCLD